MMLVLTVICLAVIVGWYFASLSLVEGKGISWKRWSAKELCFRGLSLREAALGMEVKLGLTNVRVTYPPKQHYGPSGHPPCVRYVMNAAIAVLRGSNVDDGAFVLTRLSVLSGSCRSSGARQSLDIPSECANDLRMAAGFYGYGRSRRREQYIRVGQAAEEWIKSGFLLVAGSMREQPRQK
ncbi:hypothetical protein BGY98DRAFT_939462 [Russula aff. rugulosa BPL654]|nr:hypothetical protein BGY98DRAFT_939462 [Russula aff. rugulosa BPL654]